MMESWVEMACPKCDARYHLPEGGLTGACRKCGEWVTKIIRGYMKER